MRRATPPVLQCRSGVAVIALFAPATTLRAQKKAGALPALFLLDTNR